MALDNLPLTVLLASDFPMFRESLKSHFDGAPDFEVVGYAKDEAEVLASVTALKPKLVVVDLNLSQEALCGLLDSIHSRSRARTLLISDSLDSCRVIEALQHGAHGVVSRRTTPALLIKSIQTVLSGDFWVSRAILSDLMSLIRKSASTPRGRSLLEAAAGHADEAGLAVPDVMLLGLTQRERQIIDTLVDGQTNKDIASTLGISEYTVKHHLTNIFDKLGVYNRVELVLYAINNRLCQKPIEA